MSGSRLFVWNLSWSVSNSDLQTAFSKFGNLVECTIQTGKDGRSAGYAFIGFDNCQDAVAALKAMNASEFNGRELGVEIARSRRKTKAKDNDSSTPAKRQKTTSSSNAKPPTLTLDEIHRFISEAWATTKVSLTALNKGDTVRKKKFRTSTANFMKAIRQLPDHISDSQHSSISGILTLFAEIFDDLCEITVRLYTEMEKSGQWNISRSDTPFLAKSTVERTKSLVLDSLFDNKSLRESVLNSFAKFDEEIVQFLMRFEEKHAGEYAPGDKKEHINGDHSTSSNASGIPVSDESSTVKHSEGASESSSLRAQLSVLDTQLAPSKDDAAAVKRLVTEVEAAVRREFPVARVEVFGSWSTGLANKDSDVDIALCFDECPNLATESHSDKVNILRTISHALHRDGTKNTCLANCRIPLVILKKSSPPADISIVADSNRHRTGLLKSLMASDARATRLVRLVRHWARARELGNARSGSVSSFGWTLIAVQFLQIIKPPVLPSIRSGENIPSNFDSQNSHDVADLFKEFFRFFVRTFDPEIHCVSVRSGKLLDAREKSGKFISSQHSFLQIEDPICPDDNVGRSVTRGVCLRVRREFKRAHMLLDQGTSLQRVLDPKVDPNNAQVMRTLFLS
eukprot:166595_1